MKSNKLICLKTCIFTISVLPGFFSTKINAETIPDATLGSENSVVNSDVEVRGTIADLIEGGAIRDSNLFHSFLEFSMSEGQSVYFANPEGVTNIISRVTGNNISEILGTLGVNGDANLFLLNPNGIFFGANASLDVNGSFLATTADSINFADDTQFSTTGSQDRPLLTVSAPIGLGFGINSGNIINQSNVIEPIVDSNGEVVGEDLVGLRVQPDKTLALVGGNINIEGGFITTEGGDIELGSVAANSTVNIIPTSKGFTLSYEEVENFQDINIFPISLVTSAGNTSGNIQIQGRSITIDSSQLSSFSFGEGQAGNLKVNASESLEVTGFIETPNGFLPSAILAQVFGEANGRDATLEIQTERLIVKDGGQISTDTFSTNQGLDLLVNASESIIVEGSTPDGELPSGLFAQVGIDGILEEIIGKGGTLTIETEQLIVKNGAQVATTTFSIGQGGNLTIISNQINLEGVSPESRFSSGLFSQTQEQGNGGQLSIQANNLIIRDGAQIASSTFNEGRGGQVIVNVSDSISLNGFASNATLLDGNSGIFATAEPGATNDAGNINLTTNNLIIEDGARIGVDNLGLGEGGTATINVNQLIVRDGGLVSAGSLIGDDLDSNERGAGGILTINATESIDIFGTGDINGEPVNSSIFTLAEGTGDAGDLTINTPNLTVADGGEIAVSTLDSGVGGELEITAEQLTVNNGGTITAETQGDGNAGNIILEISDSITLSGNNSGLFANTADNSTGEGGNIFTQDRTPQTISVTDGATIAVNSDGAGAGGSIDLAAAAFTLNKGAITAETVSTQGGNIILNIDDNLELRNDAEITATAGTAQAGGDGGNVILNSDFIIAFPTTNNHEITARAFEGDGGNIQISTNNILGRDSIDIDASSNFGIDGTISVETPDVDPTSGIIELPTIPIDAEAIFAQDLCKFENDQIAKGSSFIITGRGGLTPTSEESLDNVNNVVGWANRDDIEVSENGAVGVRQRSKAETETTNYPVVQQSQGWVTTADGSVWLVANSPETIPQNAKIVHPDCGNLPQ